MNWKVEVFRAMIKAVIESVLLPAIRWWWQHRQDEKVQELTASAMAKLEIAVPVMTMAMAGIGSVLQ